MFELAAVYISTRARTVRIQSQVQGQAIDQVPVKGTWNMTQNRKTTIVLKLNHSIHYHR